MRIPKRMALTISGLAFAGTTAFALGAAAPAGAQTLGTTTQHSVTGFGGCWDDWDWGGGGCGCWDGGWWW